MSGFLYIIVTPAFNEAKYIEETIQSVLAQTVKPVVWVVVDDGSTDQTAKIVKRYAAEHSWIRYIYRQKQKNQTYYSSNVYAIQEGLRQVRKSESIAIGYNYLAILDADIRLCSDYYERIFEKYDRYYELGIATGTYMEREGERWVEAKIDRRSTPKAIQVFRRECYEQCGGYIPFVNGGEDSGMEVMARMKGWQTWSFPEIKVVHNRPVGTGDGRSLIAARMRLGLTDYCLGTHPLFMLFKCGRRILWEKPYILSGAFRFFGFLSGYWKREPRQLPSEAQHYLRKEQMQRLYSTLLHRDFGWRPE